MNLGGYLQIYSEILSEAATASATKAKSGTAAKSGGGRRGGCELF